MQGTPRDIEKIDPHHHLWDLDQNYYPWLSDRIEPKMYGDYSAMRRNYLIDDYLADSGPHNIVKSVHVQANWDPSDPVGETRWCQGVADVHGFPHGIVAHADLAGDDVAEVLEAHSRHANLRGIRMILGHTADPRQDAAGGHDLLSDPAWRRGFALLERFNLSFDFQIFPAQMEAAAAAAAAHPGIQTVICHTGMPFDRSPEGLDTWRRGMARLAELPNVAAKLSGPHMFLPNWTVESYRPFFLETIDYFGPERAMIASNVPPDALAKSFDEIYDSFYELTAVFSKDECRHLFHDTAARIYRL
jgi:predicted TIM-barrel fold metal-dependent hydrolase